MNETAETSDRMDGENPVYTLDEALASVGFGKFQGLLLAYAGLGWFSDAMEVMILSFVGPVVKSQWDLSPGQESLLTTVVFAGMLVGAFTWGLVSDNYGRRKGFLGVILLTSGGGLLSAFSPNYSCLLTLRCLVGFGLGGGTVFCSWFLEFVPASIRGTRTVLLAIFWSSGTIFEASLAWGLYVFSLSDRCYGPKIVIFGIFFSCFYHLETVYLADSKQQAQKLVDIVMPRLSWRWLLAFSTLPSIALLVLYGIVPESPRYLCTKGRISDAHNILEKIALVNQSKLPPGILVFERMVEPEEKSIPSEYAPLLSSTRKMVVDFKSGFASFVMLFSSKLIRTTLLLWVLFFGNAFSYYGVILLTSELSSEQSTCGSTVLRSENLQEDSLYINVFITSLAELPGLLLSAIIVDRIGRKLSIAFMFVSAFVFTLPLVYHQSATLTIALLSGARMCIEGTYAVASVYTPELYPTTVRATGAGVANAVGRIGGMVCPLVAVGLVTGCRLTEAIILFEVVMVTSAVCVLLFPLETKGQDLRDSVDVSDSTQVVAVR